MFLLYAAKGLGLPAAIAVAYVWGSGDAVAALGVPMIVLMWYATHLRARRRAPGRDRA